MEYGFCKFRDCYSQTIWAAGGRDNQITSRMGDPLPHRDPRIGEHNDRAIQCSPWPSSPCSLCVAACSSGIVRMMRFPPHYPRKSNTIIRHRQGGIPRLRQILEVPLCPGVRAAARRHRPFRRMSQSHYSLILSLRVTRAGSCIGLLERSFPLPCSGVLVCEKPARKERSEYETHGNFPRDMETSLTSPRSSGRTWRESYVYDVVHVPLTSDKLT
ncbi:hypothetical protein EDD16DRAFT_1597086 [Pisolithus croceorrhizus]|nr:hypothetical protein EDD16DRAFT_1597086 [Pisolithus croceorrhizus]